MKGFGGFGNSPAKQNKIPIQPHEGETHRKHDRISTREGLEIHARDKKEERRKSDAIKAREYFEKHGHRIPTEWEKIKSDFTDKSEKVIITESDKKKKD